MKYEVGDTIIFTDHPHHNANGIIVEVDHEDDELPYRVKYANTNLKTWVSEEDILCRIEAVADPIPNLLDREVSTLPELFQFVGEVLIEYKEVIAIRPVRFNVRDLSDELFDIFDAVNSRKFSDALEYVSGLKDAIRYKMSRGEREEMERQERIKQLEEELAALKG